MDSLLLREDAAELQALYGREAVKHALREAIAAGGRRAQELVAAAAKGLPRRFLSTLKPAINGTGVLLHTNLGRAPLSTEARGALLSVAGGYSTVEYDVDTGERGKRQDHVRRAACELFGCEDAIAVNNNAAAVFLALSALARGKRVLVSRGELVAIGGSFKIPEILEASGAQLAEVGTTNRTSIDDYRRAVDPSIALLLTVHPSNYEIRGYTAHPRPGELRELAAAVRIPWVHDQGTGCVVELEEFGVAGEPTVRQCLADGADVVTFSGDKLLGGPQAGFAVGKKAFVARLAAHPIARVVRPDKLTLSALSATLTAWRTEGWRDLPVYRAAAQTLESLELRGGRTVSALSGDSGRLRVEVVTSSALFGGGTSPEKTFASRALSLSHPHLAADGIAARLRAGDPPIVGRVEGNRLLLDLRSIAPEEDELVAARLAEIA